MSTGTWRNPFQDFANMFGPATPPPQPGDSVPAGQAQSIMAPPTDKTPWDPSQVTYRINGGASQPASVSTAPQPAMAPPAPTAPGAPSAFAPYGTNPDGSTKPAPAVPTYNPGDTARNYNVTTADGGGGQVRWNGHNWESAVMAPPGAPQANPVAQTSTTDAFMKRLMDAQDQAAQRTKDVITRAEALRTADPFTPDSASVRAQISGMTDQQAANEGGQQAAIRAQYARMGMAGTPAEAAALAAAAGATGIAQQTGTNQIMGDLAQRSADYQQRLLGIEDQANAGNYQGAGNELSALGLSSGAIDNNNRFGLDQATTAADIAGKNVQTATNAGLMAPTIAKANADVDEVKASTAYTQANTQAKDIANRIASDPTAMRAQIQEIISKAGLSATEAQAAQDAYDNRNWTTFWSIFGKVLGAGAQVGAAALMGGA